MRLGHDKTSGVWANLRWIAPPPAYELGSERVEFRHRFELTAQVDTAWVQVWSGMGYSLSVNGTVVSRSPRAHLWTQRDEIAHLLRFGTNEISVECEGEQVHAPGILVAGEIDLGPSGRTHVFSAPDWQCRPVSGRSLSPQQRAWELVECPDADANGHPEFFDVSDLRAAIGRHYDADISQIVVEASREAAILNGGLWPSLAQLGGQALAVVVRLGASHSGRAGRLALLHSPDAGRSWSSPVEIVDSPWDDQCGVLGVSESGRVLVVAYRRVRSYDGHGNVIAPPVETAPDAETMVARSIDGGITWRPPLSLSVLGEPARAPSGKILALPDGNLLLAQYRRDAALPATFRISSDQGETWRPEQPIGEHIAGPTCIAFTQRGRLVAAQRMSVGAARRVATTYSDDMGLTWAPPQVVSTEGEQADLTELDDERLLITVGHRRFPRGVQVWVSEDAGETWVRPQRFILSADAFHDNGWPSSVQAPDGTIVTASYATGNRSHPEAGMHLEVARWRLD